MAAFARGHGPKGRLLCNKSFCELIWNQAHRLTSQPGTGLVCLVLNMLPHASSGLSPSSNPEAASFLTIWSLQQGTWVGRTVHDEMTCLAKKQLLSLNRLSPTGHSDY
ncbi:hypothetical protein BR93DRAFT_233593 [Coniochaeta sp. PMI_546]|nr:hypothetical protein BR93DRAFT_233593 [Coniochaeta sp. PMI_546]